MGKERWKETFHKWFGTSTADRWLTVAIILAFVLMFIVALSIRPAHAHGIHFSDIINKQCPIVVQGRIEGIGYVFATDCDDDGVPDNFWLLYKAGDLNHIGLHVKPLTKDTAAKYLILRNYIQQNK